MTTEPQMRPQLPQVVRVAAEIANEMPDHEDATNVHRQQDGTPGCLTGHVLYRLGLLDTLVPWNEEQGQYGRSDEGQANSFGDYFDAHTAEFLDSLQEHQDNGDAWQVAFFEACRDHEIRLRLNPKP